MPKAPFTENPDGAATIETYTVMHDRKGPAYSVLFGRLAQSGERFIANTPADAAVLADLQEKESLGRAGTVRQVEGRNIFLPA